MRTKCHFISDYSFSSIATKFGKKSNSLKIFPLTDNYLKFTCVLKIKLSRSLVTVFIGFTVNLVTFSFTSWLSCVHRKHRTKKHVRTVNLVPFPFFSFTKILLSPQSSFSFLYDCFVSLDFKAYLTYVKHTLSFMKHSE